MVPRNPDINNSPLITDARARHEPCLLLNNKMDRVPPLFYNLQTTMSKHETGLIREYWRRTGGTLVEEFPAVRGTQSNGPRYLDAVIIPDEDTRIASASEVSLNGKDIICVQAKRGRLGMYLMGQTLFSKQLLEIRFKPRSVLSVALCTRDDEVLRPLLEKHDNVKVVVTALH